MNEADVLVIVLREMRAYGSGWRADWSSFDGRTLRGQLGRLADWAEAALRATEPGDYTEGSEFAKEQWS